MREYSIVSDLITELGIQFCREKISHIEQIHLLHGINVCEDTLHQAFVLYSIGTPLEGATVIIQPANVVCYCECGMKKTYSVDQLAGHFWVCPRCERILSTRDVPDLELLEIVAKR
jgi:Zn finger protein HypA/HybF involved in hydrogenase expression